jgi:hypothetical protein
MKNQVSHLSVSDKNLKFFNVYFAYEEIIYTTGVMNNTVFIIGNLDASGYYRVNYDNHNWNLIIEQLQGNNEVSQAII